jgi:hypothetical protein
MEISRRGRSALGLAALFNPAQIVAQRSGVGITKLRILGQRPGDNGGQGRGNILERGGID